MKVKRNALTSFIDSIRLKGDIESKEGIFNIETKGIHILTKTSNNVLALKGVLKGEFEDIGKIGIGDLGLFKNFINSFDSSELEITKNKNKLVLKAPEEKLEVQANLVNPEYIKINVPEDKFNTHLEGSKGNEFILTQDIIKKIIAHSNTIKASDVILVGEGNLLTLQLSELDNKIVSSFELKENVKSFKLKFQASYLIGLLSVFNQDVIVSAITNKFLYVNVDNELYNIEYLLAPIEIK